MNRHTDRVTQRTPGHTVTGSVARTRPAHAARPAPPPGRLLACVLGTAAALAALGLATAAGLATLGSTSSTPRSAQSMTVAPPTAGAVDGAGLARQQGPESVGSGARPGTDPPTLLFDVG